MTNIEKKRAMSLMEVIVLMAAVSFLAGVFINMMFFSAAVSGIKKTGDRITSIQTAIEYYVSQNGVLPCIASLEVDYTNAEYGTAANCSASLPAGIFSSGQGEDEVVQGWVPFKTLGLRERDAYDAWGRRLRYVVVRNLTKNHQSFLTYKTKTNGVIVILDKGNNSIINTSKQFVAYMLISHGKKAIGSYDKNGKILACSYQNMPEQPKETDNCNNDSTFFYAEPSFTFDASYNDDIVRWFFLDAINSSIIKNSTNPKGRRYFAVKDLITKKNGNPSSAEDGIYLLEDSKGVVDFDGLEADSSSATMQQIPAIISIKGHVVHGMLPCKRNDLILIENGFFFRVNDDGTLMYQQQTRAGVFVFDSTAIPLVSTKNGNKNIYINYGNENFPAHLLEKKTVVAVSEGNLDPFFLAPLFDQYGLFDSWSKVH